MSITRRVKRFIGGGNPDGPYECANCGRRFELNRQSCTGCQSYRIERVTYDDLLGLE
ncbi:hypothetical protein [Salinilacihabitans rarus]|uniref:hypothetical protein n=1 Tax=Salinilacihabitans rarus TaxID=2961596 RepID=UPI0020C8BC8B|nr:hypothetical protein [Salinilacihabitans rarus]